jgi:hypothetical protein
VESHRYYKLMKLRLKFRSFVSARITYFSLNQTKPCFVLFCSLYSVFDTCILCFLCLHLTSRNMIFFFFARFEVLQSAVTGDPGLLELHHNPRRLESLWNVFIFRGQKLLMFILLWGFGTIWNGLCHQVLEEHAASSVWKCVGPTKRLTEGRDLHNISC